ncbi:S9 family peptidase, partial [Pseudomonas donghuensis]|nr:S9 family peptidase [Pseudomonas donghuensis]
PTSNPDRIIVYTMNRHQDVLNLYGVNPRSTAAQLLLSDRISRYVKEEAIETACIGSDYILLPSDRDGYMHLYLYNSNGQLLRKIGNGKFDITDVYG